MVADLRTAEEVLDHYRAVQSRMRAQYERKKWTAPVVKELEQPKKEPAKPAPFILNSIAVIKRIAARKYRMTVEHLCSHRRHRSLARKRFVAIRVCWLMTDRSMPHLGRAFGGRDHTTILHAIRRGEELVESDPHFAADVDDVAWELERHIESRA